jgi:hypothetical protein
MRLAIPALVITALSTLAWPVASREVEVFQSDYFDVDEHGEWFSRAQSEKQAEVRRDIKASNTCRAEGGLFYPAEYAVEGMLTCREHPNRSEFKCGYLRVRAMCRRFH